MVKSIDRNTKHTRSYVSIFPPLFIILRAILPIALGSCNVDVFRYTDFVLTSNKISNRRRVSRLIRRDRVPFVRRGKQVSRCYRVGNYPAVRCCSSSGRRLRYATPDRRYSILSVTGKRRTHSSESRYWCQRVYPLTAVVLLSRAIVRSLSFAIRRRNYGSR